VIAFPTVYKELGIDPETVRRLRRFQNQANINLALLGDIILASSFAAFVAYLLLKTGVAQAITWMPDRDSITSYTVILSRVTSLD